MQLVNEQDDQDVNKEANVVAKEQDMANGHWPWSYRVSIMADVSNGSRRDITRRARALRAQLSKIR